MYSEAQKRATLKWKAKAIKRYEINLHKENDADIIEYLEGKNVQGEFKRLMRARVDHNIFTNKQINLMKTCIDLRVNQLADYIEAAEEGIKVKKEVIGRLKHKGDGEFFIEKNEKVIKKHEADIKKMQKETDELKQLREYIDGVYYE